MSAEMAVELARKTLELAFLLSAPILLVATIMGLLVSVLQVMTSVQDMTLSMVPRLFAVGLTTFILLPWSLRKLIVFTLEILTDLHRYVG
jgi:flagellar biosynthetic protein FliQ